MESETSKGRKERAQGYLEVKMAEGAGQQERMENREEELAYARVEEDEERVNELQARGVLSDEEARRLRTRAKMHSLDHTERVHIDAQTLASAGVISTEQLLEEILKQQKKGVIVELLRKYLMIDKFEAKVSRERRRRAHPEFRHPFPSIDNLINYGMTFELCMFVMVAANAILTGIQISVKGTSAQNDPLLRVLEELFTVTFVIEIILRVLADGWLWFVNLNNLLDFLLIVGTGVVPTFMGEALKLNNNPVFRCGQALRCLRLVRILRTVRTRFPILWALISGVVGSARILLWTLTLMFAILYMFAIFGIQLLQRSDLHFSPELQEVVDVHFPDVLGGMFTLFQIITLDSWTGISRPLQNAYSLIGVYFLLYVSIACMVLNNLIVAVICENAFKTVDEDEELQASLQKEEKEAQLEALRSIFEEMDTDESDCLTQKEYEDAILKNEDLVLRLKVGNLVREEIMDLWNFLDFPPKINAEYFASQIRSLRGECKAKDSYKVTVTLDKLLKRLTRATNNLQNHIKFCESLQKEARLVQQELTMTLGHLQGFVATVKRCIPQDVCPTSHKKVQAVGDQITAKVQPLLRPLLDREIRRAPLEQEAYETAYGLKSRDPPDPLLDNNGTKRASARASRLPILAVIAPAPILDDVDLN
eukprot:TRINITY_DN73688_c0_g1_i1.p1 TRINITY_DN73688_c0_g1~~TRINITY_DN73688_c0_g1_i1.p1  ORF type:complete len:651 (-),score=109.76 TRINITY_DN73688_c0_g1_i1:212-2164(-)